MPSPPYVASRAPGVVEFLDVVADVAVDCWGLVVVVVLDVG
jgi:hypothetical protein